MANDENIEKVEIDEEMYNIEDGTEAVAAASSVSDLTEEQRKKLGKKRISKGELKRQSVLLVISFIFVIYGIIFYYLPLGGWIMAFQNYTVKGGLLHSEFVGFQKFKFLFSTEKHLFVRVIRNTLCMGVLNLVTTFVMAIVFAVLLNEVKNKLGKKLVQTISYLPHFLSWIIVCGIIHDSLSLTGIVNDLLRLFHITEEGYNFFAHEWCFWPIVAFANVWKETGWNAIIYLAAITAIDPCLYEAAEIDGAGRWGKMRYITLPGIAPTIMILLVMNIGNVLNAGFEIQYLLGNGLVKKVSQTIDIFVLDKGITKNDYSLGTAAGMFKSVVSIILIVISNTVAKKCGQETLF